MQHELGIAYKTAEAPGNANLGRSIAAFEAALGVRSIAATPHDWASSQLGLGNSYMILQEDRQTTLDLAARCYKAAAEVLENYGSPHDRRRAWEALGNACRDLERWDDAVSAYVCAVEAADELYEASILPSDQELELARFTDLYASTAYAMTRLEDFDLREAVVVVERGRAKRLGEVLSRTNVLGLPELDARDREALQAAVDDLHALEVAERRPGALTASIGRGFGSADSRLEADPAGQRLARAVVHAQVEAARLKVRSHINDLAERFGVPSPTKRIEWREIVGAVKEGEPIAYLLAYGNETVVLITERQLDDVNVRLMRIVGFGEKELSDILTERGDGHVATGLLFGQLTNDVQMIRDSLPAVLSVLGGKLLSKLDLELRSTGARAVIIIPTNFLISIPFHAAPYEIDGRLTRFFEEFRVSYAPSMRALSMARQRVENRERPTLAGIGNPSNDLIYAEAELRHISSLFPAGATHLLYRSDATAARTLEMLTGAKYVHLSCHGVFNPEFPLNSYLKLAEQDRITLQDLLATQNLQGVRLVTVSACSTAVVDIQRLADEVIGMPSAFIQAGAAGVLGTLWPVGDLPTALIMCRFYELHLLADDPSEREGLEPADALRSAQCWLANANAQELTAYCNERNSLRDALNQTIRGRALARMAGSARPFGNPYYWAPFIFVGA
jgi:CHAT domain-containing protein/tetratricopeptide (TPR) repeat protein